MYVNILSRRLDFKRLREDFNGHGRGVLGLGPNAKAKRLNKGRESKGVTRGKGRASMNSGRRSVGLVGDKALGHVRRRKADG